MSAPSSSARRSGEGGGIYLNHASASPFSDGVAEVMIAQIEAEARLGKNAARAAAREELTSARACVARLLDTRADNLAFGETSTALWGTALCALLGRRSLRVVTVRNEWGAQLLTLQALSRRGMIDVEILPTSEDGRFDPDDLARAARDADVVSVPLVPSLSGMRNDIVTLDDSDALLFVDAAQAVGQMPVSAAPADVLTFPARKWLGGPRGVAAMHVSDRALDRMSEPLILDQGGGTWAAEGFEPVASAARFERHDFDVAARLGMGQAARACLDAGPARIEGRIGDLSRHLVTRWAERGMPGFVERPGAGATGIWTFTSPGIRGPDDIDALEAAGVTVAGIGANYGRLALADRRTDFVVRLALHHTDRQETIDVAIDRIAATLESGRSGHGSRT